MIEILSAKFNPFPELINRNAASYFTWKADLIYIVDKRRNTKLKQGNSITPQSFFLIILSIAVEEKESYSINL